MAKGFIRKPGTAEYEAYWRDHPSEWRLLSPSEAARVFKQEIKEINDIADTRAQDPSGPQP
jgi:hypothetical protein